MTTRREVTQFSRIEYVAEINGIRQKAPEALTLREKAMLAFAGRLSLHTYQPILAGLGGFENIQRVRVYGEEHAFGFDYSLVKPVGMVLAERRKREAAKAKPAKTPAKPAFLKKLGDRAQARRKAHLRSDFAAAMKQRNEQLRAQRKPAGPAVPKVKLAA